MTFKQRLVAGLLKEGFSQDLSAVTKKYAVFTRPGHASKVFVGPSGALRVGVTVDSSRSVGDPGNQTRVYLRLLNAGTPAPVPNLEITV